MRTTPEDQNQDQEDIELENMELLQIKWKLDNDVENALLQVDALTPKRFKDTNVDHPGYNKKVWQSILSWLPTSEKPWLGMVAETGRCKTRMSYLKAASVAEHLVRESSKSIEVYMTCATDMRQMLIDKARGITHTSKPNHYLLNRPYDPIKRMWEADLLVIDDLGKGRLTDAVAEGFFSILNHRHDHNLVTIWTANAMPDQIGNMIINDELRVDMGPPLAGRLTECSKIFKV